MGERFLGEKLCWNCEDEMLCKKYTRGNIYEKNNKKRFYTN